MSSLAKFFAIVASLIGIILLGSISPASAYRSLSLERDLGKDFITFSESALETTTVYYAVCDGANERRPKRKECALHRVQANFEGDSPKENVCNFTLLAEVDGHIIRGFSKIDALGEDRAIVRWAESETILEPPHLRFSVVDFSDCRVTTTKISPDLTELMQNKDLKSRPEAVSGVFRGYMLDYLRNRDFDWPIYLKGEDDFEIVSLDSADYHNKKSVDVRRASVDADGVASKVNTWLTYTSKNFEPELHFFPLSEGKGHLFVTIEDNTDWLCRRRENCRSMTVALVQPNGQRQNLTRIEGFNFYSEPLVSLANGMIGICAHQNLTTMQCTQFRLGDKEIKWFSTNVIWEYMPYRLKRAIYNLPRGEGLLTHLVSNLDNFADKYLLKIGLDGKVKQYLDSDMACRVNKEEGFDKIFEDDRGNYCVSSACVRNIKSDLDRDFDESGYVKLRSKCFEPEDFKDVSKYIIDEQKKTLLIE